MKKASITLLFIFSALFIHAQSKVEHNVYDFGAKGDGITNDQAAIQKAIDACKEKGGTVVLEKGTFLTGQIVLVNNLTLKIDASATLLGIKSDDEKDYPHHLIDTKYPNRMLEDCQRRLIYGNKIRNVTITGGGTINGQGDYEPWMHVKEIGTEKDRPSILAFVGSNNITVSNLTLIKPACWTQVYIESNNITIQNLKVNTGQLTPNRDGIDIVDCHNVLIEDSSIASEDDGICFKSGSEYGCKDIIVRRCILDKLNVKAGNCFKLGTDGLGGFMNFDVSELILKNAYQNSAFCIESMDGAVIDNLNFRDCQITNCGQAIFILLADRQRTVPDRKTRIGAISNITFKNIHGSDFTQQYPSIITGIKGHNIQNVTFENLNFELKGGIQTTNQTVMEYDGKYPEGSYFGNTNAFGFFIRHTDAVTFKNCEITAKSEDKRPWLVQEDVKNVYQLN
ncbi:Glycosyl hydrolases family 28 [Flavobacterium flevense]|uniref:Exo-poly-alpha-D-galacturonosidase n=1 Tax=Flavobacterium flevense TaxID=983 RepID=A0A4Y4B0F3_9FLAO|nr:glycosyl hydrolase family 28 protein [Flavobacterium flevense]GEC72852.1 exo-poly-alpha-D-galacturonosidase [Flavobacterium flevense]SHL87407.1 Glycosyl hydrolases family 28 [Flavobacterium flevense]